MDKLQPEAVARSEELLALDEALKRLEQRWPDKADLVKLRYFAGFTIPEAAQTLGVSHATAERHWAFARPWLYAELRQDSGHGPAEKKMKIGGGDSRVRFAL